MSVGITHGALPTRARPGGMHDDLWPRGWFSEAESRCYQQHAERVRGGVAVEVGVYFGRSLSRIAPICRRNRTRLVAIDNWKGCIELNEQEKEMQLLHYFRQNMEWLGVWDAVEPLEADSAGGARHFADWSVDLVMVDATHEYDAVLNDVRAWWPKLRPGGVLLGHDYKPGTFDGLVKAVDYLFVKPDEVCDTVWGVTKTRPERMRAV